MDDRHYGLLGFMQELVSSILPRFYSVHICDATWVAGGCVLICLSIKYKNHTKELRLNMSLMESGLVLGVSRITLVGEQANPRIIIELNDPHLDLEQELLTFLTLETKWLHSESIQYDN